jgi:hypothetical protein
VKSRPFALSTAAAVLVAAAMFGARGALPQARGAPLSDADLDSVHGGVCYALCLPNGLACVNPPPPPPPAGGWPPGSTMMFSQNCTELTWGCYISNETFDTCTPKVTACSGTANWQIQYPSPPGGPIIVDIWAGLPCNGAKPDCTQSVW